LLWTLWEWAQSYAHHHSYYIESIILFFFFYAVILLITTSLVHLIFTILSLEVLSWIISLVLRDTAFKYLLIQGYFMLISMLRMLFFKELILCTLLFKLGAPPFHLWILRMRKTLNKEILWFFITFHKLLPLLILRIIFNKLLVVVMIIVAAWILIGSFSLFRILLLSSSSHVRWGVLLSYFSMILTTLYWLLYTFLNINLLSRVSYLFVIITLIFRLSFLVISGIPPFFFFSMKFTATSWFLIRRQNLIWVILGCSVVNIVIYLRGVLRSSRSNTNRLLLLMSSFFILFQI